MNKRKNIKPIFTNKYDDLINSFLVLTFTKVHNNQDNEK